MKADSETRSRPSFYLTEHSGCSATVYICLQSRRTARQLQPQFKPISSLAVTVDVHMRACAPEHSDRIRLLCRLDRCAIAIDSLGTELRLWVQKRPSGKMILCL
jgi:hypothetical protein